MRKASIIVPAYNNHKLTLACVNSLVQFTPSATEIIIVDDHSDEIEFLRLLDKMPKDVGFRTMNIVRTLNNGGFAQACNSGANLARSLSSILIFLNNDTEITKEWYGELVEPISESIGMTGSRLLYPISKFSQIHNRQITKGTIQHAGILVGQDLIPYHLHQFEIGNFGPALSKKTFPYVTGASLAVDRSIFETFGGFDTQFKNGCEDLDLCVRVRMQNMKVVYCPQSIAFHHETATRRPEAAKINLDLFTAKHSKQLEADRNFVSEEIQS